MSQCARGAYCHEPPIAGTQLCSWHAYLKSARDRRYAITHLEEKASQNRGKRERYMARGACASCGAPLLGAEGTYCMWCSTRLRRPV